MIFAVGVKGEPMRAIDALELKRSISVSAITEDGKNIFDIIDEQPTIEPEPEIVRCKDCKHYDGIRCFRWNSTIITGFDDFCSNAERRTDE